MLADNVLGNIKSVLIIVVSEGEDGAAEIGLAENEVDLLDKIVIDTNRLRDILGLDANISCPFQTTLFQIPLFALKEGVKLLTLLRD